MTGDAALYARMLESMRAFLTLVGDESADGTTVRHPGLLASICPEMPHRSVFNSITYTDPDALASTLADLAGAYERAGVRAWTVWTPESDSATRTRLAEAGHVLDASPEAMAAPLEEIDHADGAAGLEWERAQEVQAMCGVLEEAFGWEREAASQLFARFPELGHIYVAHIEGRPAACVAALDVGGDCGIYNVGTLAAARGRGLATGLMRQALLDARERGCSTTSLQATTMGRPVYRRLGYRELGAIEMWERRSP